MSRAARTSSSVGLSAALQGHGSATAIAIATTGQTKKNRSAKTRRATVINLHVVRRVVVSPKSGNVIRIMIAELGILPMNMTAAPIRNAAWTSLRAPARCAYRWISFATATTIAATGLTRKIANTCASLLSIITALPITNVCLPPHSATVSSSAAPEKTKLIVRPSPNTDANPTSTTAEMATAFLRYWCAICSTIA